MIEDLREIFIQSLSDFFELEAENILNGISERNLCARLAMILEPKARSHGLHDYYADVEYNRKHGRVKTILDDNFIVRPINCDLLLHSRGRTDIHDNLIAIEMKKSVRPSHEEDSDCERLRILTKQSYDVTSLDRNLDEKHVCGYMLGYFIFIDSSNKSYRIKTFTEGQLISEETGLFATGL